MDNGSGRRRKTPKAIRGVSAEALVSAPQVVEVHTFG
jgi:hypothetical protein